MKGVNAGPPARCPVQPASTALPGCIGYPIATPCHMPGQGDGPRHCLAAAFVAGFALVLPCREPERCACGRAGFG
jgi:hypothetical protein